MSITYEIHLTCDNETSAEIQHVNTERGLFVNGINILCDFVMLDPYDLQRTAKAQGWEMHHMRNIALCPVCVKQGVQIRDFYED